MALHKPYLDVPGTTIFDMDQASKGYWLNQFCMSLMKPENRERFKADPRAYVDEWPMTDEQKQVVRTAAFWLDTWLKSQYDGVETRYIIHDAAAKEVDEQTFYHTRESGGTRISSAYKACAKLIEEQFPASQWNLYCFQFSDGDNWGEDNEEAFKILGERLLPIANLFCYGQVESPYGSGEFLGHLQSRFGERHESLVLSEIEDKDAIYDSIKMFLGKGR